MYGTNIPTLRYHLAVALDKNGQQEAARQELERLLKSRKDFPELTEAQQLLSQLLAGSSE
jgi:thioredoxin-like negative regulator of GroEL